jgi:hypothetical protein
MDNQINLLLDKLIPRGGDKPTIIQISFEEYLSRLSNFNRKFTGLMYRMECWDKLCKNHKEKFDKGLVSQLLRQSVEESKFKKTTMSYSLRDIKLENEFEAVLYSMTSVLNVLTKIVACFLEGSTQIHSHTKLPSTLLKRKDFEQLHIIVSNAANAWGRQLTERRDAATHYIALSITSTVSHSKSDNVLLTNNELKIGIPKTSTKYNSLWEDDLPTYGASEHVATKYDTGSEIHELNDSDGNLIVKRESHLPDKPELIDGENYIQDLYNGIKIYIKDVFTWLSIKLKENSS